MSTVTATYTDSQGNPASGTVYLSPAARAGIGEPPDIVTEKRVWADLDAGGHMSLDVIASDDPGWLIDGQMPYLVEERLQGLPFRSYWIGVPTEGVDLADVQQVEPDVAYVPITGDQGPAGPQGPEGPQGDPGPPGGAVLSGWWQYATQTTGPAGEGEVRTDPNLGAIDSTGTLWLSSTDADGLDWSMVSPNVGDQVVLRSASGESWTLTVDAIVATGEWTVTLNSSTGTAPKRNERVQVSLVRGTNAAQVTAEDPTTGRLAIGGIEMGDTGWRDVVGLVETANDVTVTTARARRVGHLVECIFIGEMGVSYSAATGILTLPLGFRSDLTRYVLSGGIPTSAYLLARTNGRTSAYGYSAGTSYSVSWTYTTNDDWPTTLPGVPI